MHFLSTFYFHHPLALIQSILSSFCISLFLYFIIWGVLIQVFVGRTEYLFIKTNMVICFFVLFFVLKHLRPPLKGCHLQTHLFYPSCPALPVFLPSPSCTHFPLTLLSLTSVSSLPLPQTCQPPLPILCSHFMFHNLILCLPSCVAFSPLHSFPALFFQFGSRCFIHVDVSRSQAVSFWSPCNIGFALHMTACLEEIFLCLEARVWYRL